VLFRANVVDLEGLDIKSLRHMAILAAVGSPPANPFAKSLGHPSRSGLASRLQREPCFRLNQVDQAANAQIPLKLFSLSVGNRSFAIPFGELIDSPHRTGRKFPLEHGFRHFGIEVPSIGGDDVREDVGFRSVQRLGHDGILSQARLRLE
jgi:hypothetical protein